MFLGGGYLRKIKWRAFVPAVLILLFINTGFADGGLAAVVQNGTVLEDGARDTGSAVLQNENKNENPDNKAEKKDGFDRRRHGNGHGGRFHQEIATLYGQMTNRTMEDVLKACADHKMSVWQLAEKEGNLQNLKTAFMAHVKEKLSQMVKDGKISQEEMQNKLDRMQKKSAKPNEKTKE